MAETRFKLLCAAAWLAIAPWQAASGAKPAELTGPTTPREIERLVSELGAASYENRMNATRRLYAIGLPARHRLVAATRSDSPEVVLRAKRLLSAFETLLFHGLEVELKFSKPQIRWNEAIDLKVTLINRSEFTARVPIETDTGQRAGLVGDPRQVADMLDVGEWLRVVGPSDQAVGLRVDDINLDPDIAAVVHVRLAEGPLGALAAGERTTIVVRDFNRGWARMPLLDAGRYRVQFDYMPQWDDDVLNDAQVGRVQSNEAVVTVTQGAPDTVSRRGIEAGITIEQRGDLLIASLINRTDQPVRVNLNFGTSPPFAVGRWVWDHDGSMREASSMQRRGLLWQDFKADALVEVAPGDSVELTRITPGKLLERLAANGAAIDRKGGELYFTYSNLCDRNWQRREGDLLIGNETAPPILRKPLPRRILTGWHTSNRLTNIEPK